MSTLAHCPNSDELKKFTLGLLSDEEAEKLSAHLAICDSCLSQLRGMDARDEFVVALRESNDKTLPYQNDRESPTKKLDGADTATSFHSANWRGSADVAGLTSLFAPALEPDEIGRLGDFRILRLLGAGGMGAVFLAEDLRLRRHVALKFLKPESSGDHGAVERFRSEAEAAALLDHPAIVPIFEVNHFRGGMYYAMAFVEGESLAARVGQNPLNCRQAAEIMATVADGVDYAHRQGVIHRDLKPQNVLLSTSNQPRVTDFGIAKRTKEDAGLTVTGQILGTPSYMPPEQALGQMAMVGPRADVYSLGATLYFSLTGRPPIQGTTLLATLQQLQEQDPPRLRHLDPRIDIDLETICLTAMAKRPEDRYASAAHFAADLRAYLAGEMIRARRPAFVQLAWRSFRKHAATYLLSTAALVALLVLMVAIPAWRNSRQQAEMLQRFAQDLAQVREHDSAISAAKETLAKLVKLGPESHKTQRDQLAGAIIDRCMARLRQSNLDRAAFTSIAVMIAELHDLDPAAAAQLRTRLEARQSDWTEVANLKTPFASLSQLPSGLKLQDGLLRRENQDVPEIAFLGSSNQPDLRVEASFVGKLDKQTVLGVVTKSAPLSQPTSCFTFAPDGKHLLLGTTGGTVRIWNFSEGSETFWQAHQGTILCMAVIKRRNWLVTSAKENRIKIWDIATGKIIAELPIEHEGYQGKTESPPLAIAVDESWLAVGSCKSNSSGEIRRWKLPTLEELPTWKLATGAPRMIYPNSAGELLVITNVSVKKLNDQGEVDVMPIVDSGLRAYSPVSSNLAMSGGTFIRSWELAKKKQLRDVRGYEADCYSLAFNSTGQKLAAGYEHGGFKIWDLRTGEDSPIIRGHHKRCVGVQFAPEGDSVASLGEDGDLVIWNATALTERARLVAFERCEFLIDCREGLSEEEQLANLKHAATKNALQARLKFRRNGKLLRVIPIALGGSEIVMKLRQTGSSHFVQINYSPEYEFSEYLPEGYRDSGHFGVILSDWGLQQFFCTDRTPAAESSNLEQAKRLLHQGHPSAAQGLFLAEARNPDVSAASARDALCRSALCALKLGSATAIETLREVAYSGESSDETAIVAQFELLRHDLGQGKNAERRSLLDSLSRFGPEQLDRVLPAWDRQQLYFRMGQDFANRNDAILKPGAKQKILETAAAADVFGVQANRQFMQMKALAVHRLFGDETQARRIAEELKQEYDDSFANVAAGGPWSEEPSKAIEEYAFLCRALGLQREGLQKLKELADGPLRERLQNDGAVHARLRLERANLCDASGDAAGAAHELTEFRRAASPLEVPYPLRAQATMLEGYLLLESGDAERAKQAWKAGTLSQQWGPRELLSDEGNRHDSIVYRLILGALSDSITNDDVAIVKRLVSEKIKVAGTQVVLGMVLKHPQEQLAAVAKSPEAARLFRRAARGDLLFDETLATIAKGVCVEVMRRHCFDGTPSPEEYALLWHVNHHGFLAFLDERLSMTNFAELLFSFLSPAGTVTAKESLISRVPAEMRSETAYLFAMSRALGKTNLPEAVEFLEIARKNAGELDSRQKLIESRLIEIRAQLESP